MTFTFHNELVLLFTSRKRLLKKKKLNSPIKRQSGWDFPGGPVVKNLPYNAGDAGSIPGQGTKISHAAGQLSPSTTTTELTRLN